MLDATVVTEKPSSTTWTPPPPQVQDRSSPPAGRPVFAWSRWPSTWVRAWPNIVSLTLVVPNPPTSSPGPEELPPLPVRFPTQSKHLCPKVTSRHRDQTPKPEPRGTARREAVPKHQDPSVHDIPGQVCGERRPAFAEERAPLPTRTGNCEVAPCPQHFWYLLELSLDCQFGHQESVGHDDVAEHAGTFKGLRAK